MIVSRLRRLDQSRRFLCGDHRPGCWVSRSIRERDSAAPSALTLVSLPSLVIRVCLALPAELVEHWPTEPIIAAKLINGLQCAHCAFSFSRRAALCVPVQRSL